MAQWLKITKVSALKNYCLEVTLDGGVCGVVDLSERAGKGISRQCEAPEESKHVGIAEQRHAADARLTPTVGPHNHA